MNHLQSLWQIYIFPLLLSILGIYANNRSAVFSIRKNQLHKCYVDLHEMRSPNLYKMVSVIIKCERRGNFQSYSDVLDVSKRLGCISHKYDSYLDRLVEIDFHGIKLSKKNVRRVNYYLDEMFNSSVKYYIFVYKIFDVAESSIRVSSQKNNPGFISREIEHIFKRHSKYIKEINTSLKSLDKIIKNLQKYIISISHSFYYRSLLSYELSAFLLYYKYNHSFKGKLR